jgi:hypothetical protein
MGVTRRNLQAQPKILKKSSKHQINQSEQNLPAEFAGATQNVKKQLSEHQINQSEQKISQKNYF